MPKENTRCNNNYMAYKIINREDQQVFLGSGQVYGAQSIQYSWKVPEAQVDFIGQTNSLIIPQGPQIGDFSIESAVVTSDPFIKCIQSGGFNGFVMEERGAPHKAYSFYSGYLTNYTLKCSVDSIPQATANFRVVGDMGKIQTGDLPENAMEEMRHITGTDKVGPSGGFKIGAPTNVEITLDDFDTNLVSDFSLSVNIPRKDYYKLGRRDPFRVEIDYPVLATAEFTIEVNGAELGYSGSTFRGYPCKQKLKTFDVKIKDYQEDSLLTQFSFSGATLVSETYTASVQDNVKIQARYKTYIQNLITTNNNLNTPQLVTITN